LKIQSCRHELPDRTLTWNQAHLLALADDMRLVDLVIYQELRPPSTINTRCQLNGDLHAPSPTAIPGTYGAMRIRYWIRPIGRTDTATEGIVY